MPEMKRLRRPSTRQKLSAAEVALNADIVDLADLKAQRAVIEAHEKEVSKSIVKQLVDLDQKSRQVITAHGQVVVATVVSATSVSTDYTRLAKKVGTKVWTKVSTRVIDNAKLEQAIKDQLIDPNIVAEVSTIHVREPYLKVTKR